MLDVRVLTRTLSLLSLSVMFSACGPRLREVAKPTQELQTPLELASPIANTDGGTGNAAGQEQSKSLVGVEPASPVAGTDGGTGNAAGQERSKSLAGVEPASPVANTDGGTGNAAGQEQSKSLVGVELASPVADTDGGTGKAAGQEQSWSFEYDPTKLISMDTALVWEKVQCGPSCKGTDTFKFPSDFSGYQACRISFTSTHKSDQRFRGTTVGGRMIIRPANFLEGSPPRSFQDLSIQAEAGPASSIELRDFKVAVVPLSMTPSQRTAFGCVLPDDKTEWRIGQAECTEDRQGLRYSDQCAFTHRAEGSSLEIRRRTMRKIIVSKPANSEGEEFVRLLIHGSQVRELTLLPGETHQLLSKPGETFTDAEVRITTRKLGATRKSEIGLLVEWYAP